MSRKVYKYPLNQSHVEKDGVANGHIGVFPVNAHLLTVGLQNGMLVAWAEVDDETLTPTTNRTFRVYGTGWEFDEADGDGAYVTTLFDGPFVWHVYEVAYLWNDAG